MYTGTEIGHEGGFCFRHCTDAGDLTHQMNVIEAYILRRTVAIFAASLAWVLLIVWTTQVLNRLDLVTSSGQTAATFFFVALLALPPVIPIIMPFAVGIGVAQTLATMNADSELGGHQCCRQPQDHGDPPDRDRGRGCKPACLFHQ